MIEEAAAFLQEIVSKLVDHPGEVFAEGRRDERGICLTLRAAQSDMGQVIGRQGANIGALRTILRCYGAARDTSINVILAEPENDRRTFERRSSQYDEIKNDIRI